MRGRNGVSGLGEGGRCSRRSKIREKGSWQRTRLERVAGTCMQMASDSLVELSSSWITSALAARLAAIHSFPASTAMAHTASSQVRSSIAACATSAENTCGKDSSEGERQPLADSSHSSEPALSTASAQRVSRTCISLSTAREE